MGYGWGMWVRRDEFERLKAQAGQVNRVEERLAGVEQAARRRVNQLLRERADAEARAAQMAERVLELAKRPVQVIQPPDTAAIVKQTVEGIATVLNGWKDTPLASPTVQHTLSMDAQGLDDRAGVPQSLDDFVPPWELGIPPPNRGEFVNARVGNYEPYVPGQGNTAPPKGGME